MSGDRFVTDPGRLRELRREKFRPWPAAAHCDTTRDPQDISTWGPACARGFTANSRFATHGEQVIKRTNRNVSRKWYRTQT